MYIILAWYCHYRWLTTQGVVLYLYETYCIAKCVFAFCSHAVLPIIVCLWGCCGIWWRMVFDGCQAFLRLLQDLKAMFTAPDLSPIITWDSYLPSTPSQLFKCICWFTARLNFQLFISVFFLSCLFLNLPPTQKLEVNLYVVVSITELHKLYL